MAGSGALRPGRRGQNHLARKPCAAPPNKAASSTRWLAAPTRKHRRCRTGRGGCRRRRHRRRSPRKLRENRLRALNSKTLLVVDEAGMVGTPALRELLTAATAAGTKQCSSRLKQLAPVKARGSMFAQLCADLPWTQKKLSRRCGACAIPERAASLAIHDGTPAQAWLTPSTGTAINSACTPETRSPWPTTHSPPGPPTTQTTPTACSSLTAGKSPTPSTTASTATCSATTPPRMAGAAARIGSRRHHHHPPQRPHHRRLPAGQPRTRPPRAQCATGNAGKSPTSTPKPTGYVRSASGITPEPSSATTTCAGHVHHGYAITVHAAQGATAEHCHALLSPIPGTAPTLMWR